MLGYHFEIDDEIQQQLQELKEEEARVSTK